MSGKSKFIIVVVIGVIILIVALFSKKDTSYTQNSSPKVEQSVIDASVPQVKSYIKSIAKNPDSIKFIEWSTLRTTNTGYEVRCKYSGTNSFGGVVTSNQIFILDKDGKVIEVRDF